VATVARTIVELRKRVAPQGYELVSVKEGTRWYYEIREKGKGAWDSDPFVRGVGSVKGVRRPQGTSIDDALYGRRGTSK
jgi:hypothetical protein